MKKVDEKSIKEEAQETALKYFGFCILFLAVLGIISLFIFKDKTYFIITLSTTVVAFISFLIVAGLGIRFSPHCFRRKYLRQAFKEWLEKKKVIADETTFKRMYLSRACSSAFTSLRELITSEQNGASWEKPHAERIKHVNGWIDGINRSLSNMCERKDSPIAETIDSLTGRFSSAVKVFQKNVQADNQSLQTLLKPENASSVTLNLFSANIYQPRFEKFNQILMVCMCWPFSFHREPSPIDVPFHQMILYHLFRLSLTWETTSIEMFEEIEREKLSPEETLKEIERYWDAHYAKHKLER